MICNVVCVCQMTISSAWYWHLCRLRWLFVSFMALSG